MAEIRSIPGARLIGTPEQIAHQQELNRRAELRQNSLVPIYVTWTSDIPRAESQAALQGVRDALAASGQDRQVVVLGDRAWATGDYSSGDWYVRRVLNTQRVNRDKGYGVQVSGGKLLYTLEGEPWQQEPHWEAFILNRDLGEVEDRTNNFVFGLTLPLFGSVQSVTRLIREIPDQGLRARVIRRVLRHEIAHVFGLPIRGKNTTEMLGRHCTNVCTMRQGMSTAEWIQEVREEEKVGRYFCSDCVGDFRSIKDRFKPLSR